MRFDGAMLRRGFWLYVWRVSQGEKSVYYVGRTGDSSSVNAASPFSRVSRHLDIRDNAKGNTLLKRLRESGFVPDKCSYEMVAVGPIFKEQEDLAGHREKRDKVAALESALAKHLRETGRDVLGVHPRAVKYDKKLFRRVRKSIEGQLSKG